MTRIDKTKKGAPQINELTPGVWFKTVTYGGETLYELEVVKRRVAVLPFMLDDVGNMRYVFLCKKRDAFTNEERFALPSTDRTASDESSLDSVHGFLSEHVKVEIPEKETERLFYIGELKYRDTVNMNLPCYGVDLTKKIRGNDYAFKISEREYLVKRNYIDVMNSGGNDPSIYAALYLLMTYYSI